MWKFLTKELKISELKISGAVLRAANPLPGIFSGSTLKLAAVVTMAIDHFAAGVLYYMLLLHTFPPGMDFDRLYGIYQVMRGIGRTAFPIYCFLLVEGLMHTRSRARYLKSLALFALLSELPFDLGVNLSVCADTANIPLIFSENGTALTSHQNVFFTLAIGLAAMWAIEALRARFGVCVLTALAAAPIAVLSGLLAEYLRTDYGCIGVWLILAFYFLRPVRIAAAGAGFFVITRIPMEEWGFPGFLLMLFYNGKRGFLGRSKGAKYFFYIFYPAHLFLYFLLRVWLLHIL